MTGKHMLVYTTSEGGLFAWKNATEEQYEECVRTRVLRWHDADRDRERERRLHFVALVRVEKNHDFTLGGPREDARKFAAIIADAVT